MKVRLNLSTSPLESNRRFTLGASVIGALAFVLLIVLSQRAYSTWSSDKIFRARQVSLESQIATLERQRRSLATFFEDADNVKRRQRAAYLNSLIQQRAFPWIKIFMDLENILPEGARVVSIEPKLVGEDVQLRVLVGAASDESKLKFLKALEKSAQFSHIELLSESRPTRPEQSDRVMLELQAQYSVI
jgi:Tfp pilus assembly protein PilN